MSQSIIEFWNWFKDNNKDFLAINSFQISDEKKELLLDSILEHLHIYCDQLFFDIGGMPGEIQELTITAEGDVDYFEKVEDLVNNAPKIQNWSFIAFMQPRELAYVSNFEDVELKPLDIWFMPLNNKNHPVSIALQVCLPNYDIVKNSQWLSAAVDKMLETVLGEKTFALDIDHVDIKPLPEGNLEDQGFIELKDVVPFIRWKKKTLAAI